MRRLWLIAAVLVTAALGAAAATTTSAPASSAPNQQAASAGKMDVRFTVKRFVRMQRRLYATGEAIATFTPSDGTAPTTVRRPFTARVVTPRGIRPRSVGSQARICQILFLELGPLSLNLLGLHVDLDKIVLRITADSRGGLLGSLLCSLAGNRARLANKLNKAVRQSGLATRGVGFAVPMPASATPGGPAAGMQGIAQPAQCEVLDLVLGPLDLNLLGLIVHLDRVRLQITADPNGGILGQLLCGLTGGPRTAQTAQ